MSFTDKLKGELNMESKLNSGQEFIDLMGQRRSFARLEEPAPDKELLDSVFLSSLRVPDHMHLRPWRFLVIGGDDRNHLGDLFVKDCLLKDPGADIEACESARKKALRAPLIVVGIASYTEHPKVPEIEQSLATGCVLNNIGLAVYSCGYGSVWRTGAYAVSPTVIEGLGLSSNEEILGFIYIGTPVKASRPQRPIEKDAFFTSWPVKE
jgi:nitroreductase